MKKFHRRDFLTGTGGLVLLGLNPLPVGAAGRSRRGATGTTGYVYDARYLDHEHYTERAERLIALQQRMSQIGLDKEMVAIEPAGDPLAAIGAVHTEPHIQSVSKIAVTGPVASLAVAGALRAVDAVCGGTVKNAFCAIRPPGHHAHNSGGEEGFCFYGNVAIAARYAQTTYPNLVKKVLIIDWDFHHGNGTQDVFYSDPSVLFFSTHDWHEYPGTGDPSLKGDGDAAGLNINVHMEPGSGDDDFVRAWEAQLLPAAESFKPDLVLISAGFDSKRNDLLGSFDLTECGFARLTGIALDIAAAHCGGRLVSVLEGGYADRNTGNTFNGFARSVTAHITTLLSGTSASICAAAAHPRSDATERYELLVDGRALYLRKSTNERITVTVLTTGGRVVMRATAGAGAGRTCIGALPHTSGCFVARIDRAGHQPRQVTFDLL